MSVVRVEVSGGVAEVTITRPEKLNALSEQVLTELGAAWDLLAENKEIRVAILTGAGDKAFVAGADIAAMENLSPLEARHFAHLGHGVARRMETARFPIVAAVNGFALGGGTELALACDFIYASDKAKFGQPEVTLGVIPGFGGTQRLLRRIPASMARELCMTGDIISAEEALRIGLVNRVFPHAELLSRTREVAKKIAEKSASAIRSVKRVLHAGENASLATALDFEAEAFAALFGSHDQREGMKAFVEKRPAKFEGLP